MNDLRNPFESTDPKFVVYEVFSEFPARKGINEEIERRLEEKGLLRKEDGTSWRISSLIAGTISSLKRSWDIEVWFVSSLESTVDSPIGKYILILPLSEAIQRRGY